ncbi:unnamed protein product [Rhodiola kirilowii]
MHRITEAIENRAFPIFN